MTASTHRHVWLGPVVAAALLMGQGSWALAAEPEFMNPAELEQSITNTLDTLRESMGDFRPATQTTTRNFDGLAAQAIDSLEFAREAMAKGDLTLASDSLSVARGLIGVALAELPEAPTEDLNTMLQSTPDDAAPSELKEAGMTLEDIRNVKLMVDRMTAERATAIDIPEAMGRLEKAGFNMARLEEALGEANLSTTDVAFNLEAEIEHMAALSSGLSDLLDDPSLRADFAAELRDLSSRMGVDLQDALEAVADIRDAIDAGGGLDLDTMAQDIGFDNFADAVNAYNEAYGTDYTESEARDALGE